RHVLRGGWGPVPAARGRDAQRDVTDVDELFTAARRGNRAAFRLWVGRVERPMRASLHPFALSVDVEGVVQEALLRMWVLASDTEGRELTGENASLRFAIGLARNIARNEARRNGRLHCLPPEARARPRSPRWGRCPS